MDDDTTTPELLWLDQLYRNLSAHLENLAMIENKTNDHQTRQQLVVQRRALNMELVDIKQRMEALKKE